MSEKDLVSDSVGWVDGDSWGVREIPGYPSPPRCVSESKQDGELFSQTCSFAAELIHDSSRSAAASQYYILPVSSENNRVVVTSSFEKNSSREHVSVSAFYILRCTLCILHLHESGRGKR